MTRKGSAVWKGSGKEGKGTVSVQSGVIKDQGYSWSSRFEETPGTNPEELIGAAHAGCFSMKLSFVLGNAGATAEYIHTTASVTIDSGTITNIHLDVKAKVPGMDAAKFTECANDAKANCPVSKALSATNITMDAKLE